MAGSEVRKSFVGSSEVVGTRCLSSLIYILQPSKFRNILKAVQNNLRMPKIFFLVHPLPYMVGKYLRRGGWEIFPYQESRHLTSHLGGEHMPVVGAVRCTCQRFVLGHNWHSTCGPGQ